ncbi:MAG: class I SAM-dependent methyltransferase [Candidatus Eremiobacteraeota bacterium]|nr:class I SAM-dependent methyltransferase [Candidatus Eremiobacteraeota bacterium]
MIDPPSFLELARQALSSTRRGYDLLAPKFEETPYATPLEWLRSSMLAAQERYPIETRKSRGLDLACGTGRGVRMLRTYCREVEGIDFSPGMLEQAERFSRGTDGISYRQADLQDISLPTEHFDRIVTFGAWGHILPSFRQRLLEQIVSALRPGGAFVTLTSNEPVFGEKRYWFYFLFDLAIRLRNLLWFGEFHMYYRLNSTRRLMEEIKQILEGTDHYRLSVEPLPGFEETPLALVMVYKASA